MRFRGPQALNRQIAIQWRQYWRYWGTRRRVFDKGRDGLALVGSKSGDIYQCRDFRIVPGFSDHSSAVGVADENGRSILNCEDALGSRHVVG